MGRIPTYLDEKTWYNPLTPGITAVASAVLDLPVHVVATQIGAYINVLAPLGVPVAVHEAVRSMDGVLRHGRIPVPDLGAAAVVGLGDLFAVVHAGQLRAGGVLSRGAGAVEGAPDGQGRRGISPPARRGAWSSSGHTGPALILGGMNCLWRRVARLAAWRERDPARRRAGARR